MRKHHWWNDYNWLAPLYWFEEWLKKKYKKILRALGKIFLVAIAIYISTLMPTAINIVKADYTNKQEIEKRQKEQIEREARDREEAYKQRMANLKKSEELDKQKKIDKEIRRINAIEDEINSQFSLHDRIQITWLGDGNGAVIPNSESSVGFIKKISGEYIYGTWSDRPLKYGEDHWKRISAKEMREMKEKELARQNRIDKQEIKKWTLTMSEDEKKWYQSKGIIKNLKK